MVKLETSNEAVTNNIQYEPSNNIQYGALVFCVLKQVAKYKKYEELTPRFLGDFQGMEICEKWIVAI